MFLKTNKKNHKGFSLIEMLFYVAVLTLFMIVSVNASILMMGMYANSRHAKVINRGALATVSTFTAETRKSLTVNPINSNLGTNPGKLALISASVSGVENVVLELKDGAIELSRNGLILGQITPPGARVESLIFNHINNNGKEAVRMTLTIVAEGNENKSETFYYTATLRGSY
jgi:hypothetical protein